MADIWQPADGGRRKLILRVASASLAIVLFNLLFLGTAVLEQATVTVPFNADEIVARCRSLHLKPRPPPDFYSRTHSDRFQPGTSPILIRNATIWTGRVQGLEVLQGDVLLANGIIRAVGHVPDAALRLESYKNTTVINAHGAWVTPGVVDIHAHLGVEPAPSLNGAVDGNSFHGPIVPWLRALDGLNTHDEGYLDSIAGGVTTALVLPGSANGIGGQGVVIKLRPTAGRSPSDMLLEPPFLYNHSDYSGNTPLRWRHVKHACGENPARVYGASRMDTVWADRQAYNEARKIKIAQDEYCEKALSSEWSALEGQQFPFSLQWEPLVDVLRGRVKVQTHCYEAVDIDAFVRLSQEFEFPVAAFHHAHEAYLVPEVLRASYESTPAIAMFSAFSRYKREAYRHSEYAPRILADEGIDVIIKSDHPANPSRILMHQAAEAHYYGLQENLALSSVTTTPAKTMGLDHRIGYIREGFDADLVIWDSHPLSIGATPSQVFIDGIPQLPNIRIPKKAASLQNAPATPDFFREAEEALAHDGLPPLDAKRTISGTVAFVNVSQHYSQNSPSITGAGDTVVIARGGRVVCSGRRFACASLLALPDIVTVDLAGGALQPGLIAYGSSLGLGEIAGEPDTTDGPSPDALRDPVPHLFHGNAPVVRAVDGLMYGSRDALVAYRAGVTLAITAPSPNTFLSGLSAAFALGARHKLEDGAVVQDVVALHLTLGRDSGPVPSVSTRIGALRRLLLRPGDVGGEYGQWFGRVAEGTLPLVINVDSADIIASLVALKHEVEERTGKRLKVTIAGATEAHLLAAELAEARIGVLISHPRAYPYTWDSHRGLPGPPLTEETSITTLLRHNVSVGITAQGISTLGSGALEMANWGVRNLRFAAAQAWLDAPGLLDKAGAFALAADNVKEMLGLDVDAEDDDVVVTRGGDLLGYEGKVVGVISPRRGVVDIFE